MNDFLHRLPTGWKGQMHNQVMLQEGFQEHLVFYTLGREITENSWIISHHFREDDVVHTSISAPLAVVEGKVEIDERIKECLSSPTSQIIDWDNGTWFVALDKVISKMIFDISVNIKGNVIEVHPCNLYYMDIDDALRIEADKVPTSLDVRRLDAAKQEEDFIVSGWKYSKPNSNVPIKQCISVCPSGGVFREDKCLSGVYTAGYGLLSAVYTDKEERRKGYGKMAMNFAFKDSARHGCIPCLTVEQRNMRSIQFNEALGAKLAASVDWMGLIKLEVD